MLFRSPDQVRRFAKRMETEAQRLGRITREIIELSRLQAADVLTDAKLIDVDTVVSSAIDQNHVQLDTHRVTIVSGGETGTEVYGDEGLLVLALHNLIANAVQYSQPGTRVGVGVRLAEGVVEIAVTDQGIGIPEEDLARVFERFFRVDQARSRNTGGTGLIQYNAIQEYMT